MREAVGLPSASAAQRAHRERERLVLLDQVEEAAAAERSRPRAWAMWAVHQVVATKRSARLTSSARRLAAERDLDRVEEPRRARCRPRPAARQSAGSAPTRVDGRPCRTRSAALGQPAGEVELGDVAAEEVLEVDRRDQQVDPLRRVVATRPARAARSCRATRRAVAGVAGGRAPGRGAERRRRHASRRSASRAVARAWQRQQRAARRSRRASIHSAPSVSAAGAAQLARAAQRAAARRRAASGRRARSGAARGACARGDPVAAAQPSTVGELRCSRQASTK